MFGNAVNVKQLIFFRVTEVADQLFEFRLYTAYSFRGIQVGFNMFKQRERSLVSTP